MRHAQLPIVVVGGGAAGLATALAMAPAPVRLLCRAHDGRGSASALAQGGIAAALDPRDSAAAHAADTLIAGAQHNDVAMVQWLAAGAPAAIAWLQAQGVVFDRDAQGCLQLGREGGHSAARIVHAGGDASGAALVHALRARVQEAAHVQWRGGVDVDGLLLREGCVAGVRTRDERGRHERIEASTVVLATGGIGALYARTSNPPGADGAGLALGLAAGAAARDLEFVQFHPTALDVPGHCLPLITEALRGAGARLHDGGGHALMAGVHPLGDLAPRDVVARRVAAEQAAGGRVWLDATGVDGDWARRFPTVLAACCAHGFDPRRVALPVTPAAHFHMGGLATDADGRTSVPGLYAVGEVACNGVHGANRLASNSLLEGVLGGRRLGELLANTPVPAPGSGPLRVVERGESLPPAQLAALHALLWQAAGPVREARALRDAWRVCAALAEAGWQARLAKALLRAMRLRRHSLGAHWRQDRGCPR
ncbi:L-aspartate oxidase [Rhodanobacter thiooxydans]|uniref:L-aspartate oxidase n=1 Tax=Rhodanobacter thiooxydans TaxID=416169 RepID=A0A154QM31_9GAMM|nr:FAD-binding protein [Rhodanobacter thiooxydans]EIL96503.1 L-aspartate oxidase [Rhodanobacter thiooxydans LCS2]KZC25343.1 L-aspartate oxidase [Rhodanobacter thiooxydans]MCW0203175.1 FAD-dependent oxidoreductase [Rhodanobacter thiooxydans]